MNPPCKYCGGRAIRYGWRDGRQRYRCVARCKHEIPNPNPPCSHCGGRTRKQGRGPHQLRCVANCRRAAPPQPVSDAVRRERRQQAAQLDAALLTMIRAALPSNLPADLADDISQEMAVAALCGDFDLSDLLKQVPLYRTRINRLSSHPRKFISIDSFVPGTNRLNYADTLIG